MLLHKGLDLPLQVTKNIGGISTGFPQALGAKILRLETAVSFEITPLGCQLLAHAHVYWGVRVTCGRFRRCFPHIPKEGGIRSKVSFFHIHTGNMLFWE